MMRDYGMPAIENNFMCAVIQSPPFFHRGFTETENLFLVLRFVPPQSVESIHMHAITHNCYQVCCIQCTQVYIGTRHSP